MAKVTEGSISDLKYDDKNFNKHTEYGMSLLEKSLRKLGAGRSVVVDQNDRIIGGNGVIETAANIGMEKTVVVETAGDEIVVVKRTDIDLDSEMGREMALADNVVAHANYQLDTALIQVAEQEYGIDAHEYGVELIEVAAENNSKEQGNDDDVFDKWYSIADNNVPVDTQLIFAKDNGMLYVDGMLHSEDMMVHWYGVNGEEVESLDEFTHYFEFSPIDR